MSLWSRLREAGGGLLRKFGIMKNNNITEVGVARLYPRYSHVSVPITKDMKWLSKLFGNAFALRNAERGVTVRSPVRQTIKQLERDPASLVATFNNKQRRKWRAKVRKHAATLEAQK